MNEASPITVTANGETFEAPEGCPLPDFLEMLKLAPARVVVERNGEALSPGDIQEVRLNDGDRLEIVRIVAGG